MTGGNAEQRDRRTFGLLAIVLPAAKRVYAYAERFGKLSLRQPDEAPQSGYITRLEFAAYDAFSLASPHGSREIGLR